MLPHRCCCSIAQLYLLAWRPIGFAPPLRGEFTFFDSAHKVCLSASTLSMYATNAPYTESQSYAIPLGENYPQHDDAPCRCTLHVISQRRRTISSTRGRMCMSENAGFVLVKTCN
jgi:hypothetical protein